MGFHPRTSTLFWRSLGGSSKKNPVSFVGNVKLTFEELATVLAQVDACLNSHPLTSLPGDYDSLQVLTPGHFLLENLLNPSLIPLMPFVSCPRSIVGIYVGH